MTPATLAALRGSIEKWEAIVAGTGVDRGSENCPLCKMFFKAEECTGCPVMQKTGRPFCRGTPYDTFSRHADFLRGKISREQQLAAARDELEFLKSLLPGEGE